MKILNKYIILVLSLLLGSEIFAQVTVNYSYTGAVQTFVVPSGVYSIDINAFGAEGGSAGNNTSSCGSITGPALGGDGGSASGTLAVTPGQTIYIYVGGKGGQGATGGFNGGGLGQAGATATTSSGGGASDIRVGGTALSNRVLVAGGGGGAEWTGGCRQAGAGGGLLGGTGIGDNAADSGRAGTQSAGGAGGTNACSGFFFNPTAGSLGQGGNSAQGHSGAGGGGYYGGGGGGCDGHGGGGSSYIGGVTNGSTTSGVNTGDGSISITYTLPSGEALNFDGTNDQVVVPSATRLNVNNSYTFEAWVNTDNTGSWRTILSKGNGNGTGPNGEEYIFSIDPTNRLGIFLSGVLGWRYSTNTISNNTWTHVAVTNDGTDVKFYINGVLSGTASSSALPANNDGNSFYIGRQGFACNCNFFAGSLDEIRVWNTVRTCAQIKGTYTHNLVGNETGLVAYYQLNEGVAGGNNSGVTNVPDAQTNYTAANGTATSFTLSGSSSNWIQPGSGVSGTTPDAQPEIDITGNSVSIADGDITPSVADHTDFGTVTTLTRTFTIVNSGTATLNISSITSTGANASDFVVSGAPSSVAASSSATFDVNFTAGAYGVARNATITVNNSDCDESAYDFAVTAFGLNPGIPPVGSGIAYSLRKIEENYNGPAIQVRRTCDNAVKDIGFDDCGDLDTNALKTFVYGAPALGALGTTSQAAFSLRNLGCGYAGAAIQVRRSSDNTTQDIGFTSTGDLDTASLLSFVGSNSGYVTIWYDQSGNGRNATQATANNQPRIVNAGVIERQNGKPALRFLTINSGLATASFTAFNSAATFNGVAKVNTNLTYNAIVSKTGSGGSANIPSPIDFYNKRHVVGNGTSYAFYDVTNDFVASKPLSIWTFQAQSGGTFDAYYNGAANGTAAVGSNFSDVGNPLYIGKRADGVTGLNGWISEILTFASFPSTADRQYFEYTQALYYGISGPSYAAPSTPPSGYVAKWYDQSGNGRDASQTTASAQPRIMNAGVVERIAGRPTMVFSGAQTLQSASNPNQLTTSGDKTTLSAVFQNANNIASCLVSNGEATTNRYLIHASWSDNQTYFDIGSWNSGGRLNGALTWTSPAIGTFIRNGAKGNVYQNGTNMLSSSSLSTAVSSTNNIWIGSFDGTSTYIQGAVSELIAYPNALNTVRKTLLENNQSEYYGIGISNDKYSPVDANYLRNMDGIGFEASNDSAQRTIRNDGFEMEDLAPGATNFLKDAGDYMVTGRSCAVAPATSTNNINLAQGIVQRWITDWEVKKSDVNSNGGNVKFIFDFDAYWQDNIAPGVANNYVLLYRSSSSGTFDTLAVVSKAVVGHKVIFVVNSTNINTFFTIGTVDLSLSPLPVDLVNFKCNKNNVGSATITWNTVSETNNDYFSIEKSSNGKTYTLLTTIQGYGNSSQLRGYSFTDNDLGLGLNYYRIKQTDLNGVSEIKDICVVQNFDGPKDGTVTLFPNPSNSYVQIEDTREEGKTISVLNSLGQTVSSNTTFVEGNVKVDCSGLSEGIYFIQLRYSDGMVINKKFIIQR